MKALIPSCTLTVLLTATIVCGQNFRYTSDDTVATGNPGQTVYMLSLIRNLEPQQQVYWVGITTDFPNTGWSAAYCFNGSCYPPEFSPASLTLPAFGSPDDTERVSLEVTIGSVGMVGYCTIFVYPDNHPELADSIRFSAYNAVGISPDPDNPIKYTLLETYPNPFNSTVNLTFSLLGPGKANLAVYDLQGHRVAQIFQGHTAVGEHRFTWNPENLASGIYLARLKAGGTQQVRKVVYLR